jgi:tRNA(fMet)-specific endonuclease VapC
MHSGYLLDTNIVSHIMQGRDELLLRKLQAVPVGQVHISSVTLAELMYGLHRRNQPAKLMNALDQLLLHMDALPWTEEVARTYGKLSADLERKGINLSDLDMMIAAHAKHANLTLVSRDKAFKQLNKDLILETW